MIEIKARSPQDGWAFVQEDGATFLVYPPYRTRQRVADPRAVDRAVTTHGFTAESRQFPDWAAVIKVLADEYVEAVKKRSIPADFDFIRDAPAATLRGMLTRVTAEFIPVGDLDGAERFIADVLTSNAAGEDRDLRTHAVDALRQVTAARQKAQERAAELLDRTALIRELAPLASERYTAEAIDQLATAVRERGLWFMAA